MLAASSQPSDDGRGKQPVNGGTGDLSPPFRPRRRCALLCYCQDASLGQMSTGPSGTGAGLMMALSEAVATSTAPVRRYCVHATRATVGDKVPDLSDAP
jgi:hypothetical protein